MTKAELLEMAKKLQAEAEAMPDETPASASTEGVENPPGEEPVNKSPGSESPASGTGEDGETEEVNANGELEESKQIEPQTNGKITDDIAPGVDVAFEQSTTATEVSGAEQVISANIDERFATVLQEITTLKMEQDKINVAMSQILTRIELVQEVTDKVVSPISHDTLLTDAVKLLV